MSLPSTDYRRTALPPPEELPRGLDAVALRATRYWHGIARAAVLRQAAAIAAHAETLAKLPAPELALLLAQAQAACRRSLPTAAPVLREALAAVGEMAYRVLGLRPHPVQYCGALVLLRGGLAEMATGEGKTLTVALAGVLAGWARQPCHMVTANDYLAARDAEWLAPFYQACGLSCTSVVGDLEDEERRANYRADVVYTTSKELLADFLRDRLRLGALRQGERRHLRFLLAPERQEALGLVLRGLHTAFIDEADNILIDEAVTPLLISRQQPNQRLIDATKAALVVAQTMEPGRDYRIHETTREIEYTAAGWEAMQSHDPVVDEPDIFRGTQWRSDFVRQALKARSFFQRDTQYVVEEGKIQIVDESTGRLMPNRSWRQGLHQAVEAREGVKITAPAETMARMSFQRFFRSFRRLSGLTGTGREATGEFHFIYRLPVVAVPTNRPIVREEWPDRFFVTEAEKWTALVIEIRRLHALGRPLLIGTRSIAASEHLAALLRDVGLRFTLLNAVRSRDEASIIAAAGGVACLTVATNMAGRGTDIKLSKEARALGGLHVIATERHDSRRIDRQLFGRAGRQGDPGSAQAFVSLEDDLCVRHLSAPWRRILEKALQSNLPAVPRLLAVAIRRAQAHAQSMAYRQRQSVVSLDRYYDQALGFAGAE